MTDQRVLVVGATGRVGRHIVQGLSDQGVWVTALVRSPRAAALPESVRVVEGDLYDPESVHAAADGVRAAFLLWPSFDPAGAVEAVQTLAGQVDRVVYLSAAALQEPVTRVMPGVWSEVEGLLQASTVDWTFLRAGGFAANTLHWSPQIRAGDVVQLPYPAARRSLVHERDLADAAVTTLLGTGHHHRAYALTGPESLSQAEQVQTIGTAVGRNLRAVEQSRPQAKQDLQQGGFTSEQAEQTLNYWESLVERPELVSDDLDLLTGRPARDFATWATDHVDSFS